MSYTLIRLRNVFFQQLLYRICRSYPKYVKRKLIDGVKKLLPNHDIFDRDDWWDDNLKENEIFLNTKSLEKIKLLKCQKYYVHQ